MVGDQPGEVRDRAIVATGAVIMMMYGVCRVGMLSPPFLTLLLSLLPFVTIVAAHCH